MTISAANGGQVLRKSFSIAYSFGENIMIGVGQGGHSICSLACLACKWFTTRRDGELEAADESSRQGFRRQPRLYSQ